MFQSIGESDTAPASDNHLGASNDCSLALVKDPRPTHPELPMGCEPRAHTATARSSGGSDKVYQAPC